MRNFFYILIVIIVIIFPWTVKDASAQTMGVCDLRDGTPPFNTDSQTCSNRGGDFTAAGTFDTPPRTQQNQKYILLAPIDIPGGIRDFDPAQEGAFGKYLDIMLKVAIGLSAVMAVMMFVIGGVEYMTSELIHTKESAKDRMGGAVFGLIIILGSWALLNTINPNLLNSELSSIGQVKISVEVGMNDRVAQTSVNGVYANGAKVGTPWVGTRLTTCTTPNQTGCLPKFVTLNNPECTEVGQQNCTSTFGLDTSKLRAVQWGCECPLVLSGGTEWWLHGGRTGSTNHQSGGSTVDIRTDNNPNTPLNKYLSGGQPLVPYQTYNTPVGPAIYEGDHWHIGT